MKTKFKLMQAGWLAGLLVAALLPERATACIIRSDVPSSEYEAHSLQYQGQVLWIKFMQSDGTFGVASAVRLNEQFGLTAAHVITAGTPLQIGNGNNFNSNLGEVRNISEYLINPNYVDSGGFPRPADIAIIKFDYPLAGKNVTIASPVYDQRVTAVGFGRYGSGAIGGVPQQDGRRRAWDSTVYYKLGDVPYYIYETFWPEGMEYYYGIRLNGFGGGGDSGGPTFDQWGQLVALSTAASGGSYTSGFTYSAQLDVYQEWIATRVC